MMFVTSGGLGTATTSNLFFGVDSREVFFCAWTLPSIAFSGKSTLFVCVSIRCGTNDLNDSSIFRWNE